MILSNFAATLGHYACATAFNGPAPSREGALLLIHVRFRVSNAVSAPFSRAAWIVQGEPRRNCTKMQSSLSREVLIE